MITFASLSHTFQMIFITAVILALALGNTFRLRNNSWHLHDFNAERTLPLRGIAAIIIVLCHVARNVPDVPVLNQALPCGSLAVSLFFFLSGYGLMISYINKGDGYLDGFLRRRFVKMLPAYLTAAIGFEIYQLITRPHNPIASIAAIAHGSTILPDSWFIIVIMLYYLLFYVIARLVHNSRNVVIALWVASAFYIITIHSLGWGSYWYKTVCAINIGFTYALVEKRLKEHFANHRSSLLAATWLLAIVSVSSFLSGFTSHSFQLVGHMLTPLLVVLAVYVMGMCRSRVLNFLGTISYEIYVMQCIWRHKLFVTSSLHWSVYLISTLAVTIFTAWLLNRVFKKLYTLR